MDDGRTSSASSSSRSTSSPPASACEIELTERARELLANLGYDPTYGARPLKRVVQKQLVDKLALRILEGEFSEGDTVEVDAHDGDLSFAKARGRARKPEAERAAA